MSIGTLRDRSIRGTVGREEENKERYDEIKKNYKKEEEVEEIDNFEEGTVGGRGKLRTRGGKIKVFRKETNKS